MFSRIGLLFWLYTASLFGVEDVYLKTPDLSRQNIMGFNVGIRPFRKTGVRLEAETLQNKLIIHNYGYGGSGLTLCFGGANEVLDILNAHQISSGTVAVLGAGVIGLATAYTLLERGYEVHLYADQWSPYLTSNVGAGIWTPYFSHAELSLKQEEFHQRLLDSSEERFSKSLGCMPEFQGITKMAYYVLADENNDGEEVLIHFDNGVTKQARRNYRIAIDGKVFMDDLFCKVKMKGACLLQKRFENLEEVMQLKERIIINCLSLGSREIFNDPEFIPVRGQLVYFYPQEGIDYKLAKKIPNPEYYFHIHPWCDRLILGGSHEENEESLTVTPEVIDTIIENAKKCLSGEQ